jgi:TolB-like protein
MNRALRRWAIMAPLCLTVSGCSSDPDAMATSSSSPGTSLYEQADLSSLTYRAVDLILAGAPDVSRTTPLVVASLADAQDLESSSALGNIVADMIRTRLAQTGHKTSEVRLRNSMSMKKGGGEFLLSRTRSVLMAAPNTAAVVTGTYATSYEKVYVSIKLISATDARILAGADFVVPLRDVLGLIQEHRT